MFTRRDERIVLRSQTDDNRIRVYGFGTLRQSDLLSACMTTTDILEDYEDLKEQDVLACLLFAAKMSELKSIYKLKLA